MRVDAIPVSARAACRGAVMESAGRLLEAGRRIGWPEPRERHGL